MGTTEFLRQVVSFDNPPFSGSFTQLLAALLVLQERHRTERMDQSLIDRKLERARGVMVVARA